METTPLLPLAAFAQHWRGIPRAQTIVRATWRQLCSKLILYYYQYIAVLAQTRLIGRHHEGLEASKIVIMKECCGTRVSRLLHHLFTSNIICIFHQPCCQMGIREHYSILFSLRNLLALPRTSPRIKVTFKSPNYHLPTWSSSYSTLLPL